MPYRFQVRVCVNTTTKEHKWKDVHPNNEQQPYEYETRAEAEKMAYICYGNDPTIVRVVKI
jgi:hypothetical protein